jgi:hypothetical protein
MLVDTSILIPIFRDKSGSRRDRFRRFLRGRTYVLTRFTQLELLQGCSSEAQWESLNDYLNVQDFAEMLPDTWSEAGRIYFELKRKGLTVGSINDCCIAQIAIENRLTIVHNDKDFETIDKVRPMRLSRFDIQARD